MPTGRLDRARADEAIDRLSDASSDEEGLAEILELIDAYETLPPAGSTAQEVREAFLLALKAHPKLVANERVSTFLAERIEPSDLGRLDWGDPEEVVAFSETLFSFPFESEEIADRVKRHVNELLREVLHQYERQRAKEHMFLLMQYAPTLSTMSDVELFRLRHRTYLYEMHRVRRNRRLLHGYLLLQLVLVFFAFPLLFIQAENGQMQETIESMTRAELKEEPRTYYTYADGVYWAIITAASIGYGDVTPHTSIGRFMAATLGAMGVITVGVIAGLILEWVTPRRID